MSGLASRVRQPQHHWGSKTCMLLHVYKLQAAAPKRPFFRVLSLQEIRQWQASLLTKTRRRTVSPTFSWCARIYAVCTVHRVTATEWQRTVRYVPYTVQCISVRRIFFLLTQLGWPWAWQDRASNRANLVFSSLSCLHHGWTWEGGEPT